MGPESIQRAPCPTCGNTEPRGGVTRPAKARPPAGRLKARRTATAPAATDKPDAPPIEAKPAAPSKIRDAGAADPFTHGDRPAKTPGPGEGVARRAAVEADHLRSPARWLRNAPSTDTPQCQPLT